MSTYSTQINTILRDRLVPKMRELSMEVAKIEPYSYSNTRLEDSRRQLDYMSMIYDFLYEYTIGEEELENGKLINVVRLIDPPTRNKKKIELLLRSRTNTKVIAGYKFFINDSEVNDSTIITPGEVITITAVYTPAVPINGATSITLTVDGISQTSSGLMITLQNKDIPLTSGGLFVSLVAQATGAAPEIKTIPIDTIADSTFYYGVGAVDLNVSGIQALTKVNEAVGNKTFRFSPVGQVMYFAYPLNYGALTAITDPNGFQIISDFTHTSDKVFTLNLPNGGVTGVYHVYEFNNITTQTNFDITFKF